MAISDARLIEVANLFYNERFRRKEIADRMGTDIRGVSRMLDLGRERNLVQIHIAETVESSLAERLKKRYSDVLRHVLIVGGAPITKESQEEIYLERIQRCAGMAASYIDELVEGHALQRPLQIGVTGGESCLELANALPVRPRNIEIHATSVIPHGDLALSGSHVDPSTNATIMWSRSGRISEGCHYVTATPYDVAKRKDPRAEIQKEIVALKANPHVRKAIERLDELDIAIAGIGVLDPPISRRTFRDRLTMTSLLESVIDVRELQREKAIGDLSYCLFDSDGEERPVNARGEPLPKERWQLFITAGHYNAKLRGVQFYRQMVKNGKTVMAIAGPFKAPVIRAALKAGAINVLVTDEYTVRQLLHDPASDRRLVPER